MYMNVINSQEDYLHLSKTPGIKSISIFVGIVSLGLGAAYYGPDAIWLKVMYVAGSAILGLTFLDEWEDFIVDRSKNAITLRRATTFQKMLCRDETRCINLPTSEVIGVRTDRKEMDSHVILLLKSGMQVAISETHTNANINEIELTACKIESFLKLSRIENVNPDECRSYENEQDTTDSEEETDRYIVTSLH